MWEGIPFWYRIGLCMIWRNTAWSSHSEPYTYSFAPEKKKYLSMEETLRHVAKLIMDTPYAYNLERRIEHFEKWIDEYKLDGVILHEHVVQAIECRHGRSGRGHQEGQGHSRTDPPV